MPVDITANYIRIRVASPEGFNRLRIKTIGKGIKAIIGFKKSGSTIQSFLFMRERYTLAQAKAWIKEHKYSIHESLLVTDILVGTDFLEFQETVITVEMETELMKNEVEKMPKERKFWEWLFNG